MRGAALLDGVGRGGHNARAVATDATKTAGRGLLSITGAKIYFIVTSYGIQLLLPRLLTPEEFGLFSTAMNVASIVNNVLIVSTVQSVSKFVSEDDARGGQALRRGLGIQLVLGSLLCLAFLVGAGPVSGLLLDASVAPLVRTSAVVVFAYALYASLVGSLNGRRLFQKQALLDCTFSTLRTFGILGASAAGLGALGAMTGFAGAAALILLVAMVWVGLGEKPVDTVTIKRWLAFTAPLWLYHGFLNGVMQIDLALLKRTAAELGLAAGMAADAAAAQASVTVGYYRAVQTFAFVPYQLILSITFIIFPMVSKAIADGDHDATKRYVRAAMRVSILFLVSIAAPIAGASRGVMRLAYPDEYLVGAGALSILVLGMAAFALFVITATIITSAGRPGAAATVAGFALVVVVAANLVLVRQAGLSGDMLRAAAMGTTAGTCLALAGTGWLVFARFKALVAPLTVLRAAVAGAVGYVVAELVSGAHPSRILTIGALAAGFFAFGITLVVVRELKGDDFGLVRRILKR